MKKPTGRGFRTKAFEKIPFKNFLKEPLDASLSGIEGMLSPNEWRFLRWYARTVYSSAGVIVDLGSWLGSSVMSLASGLVARRKAPRLSHKIHAYDTFVWHNWMAKSLGQPKPYKDGDSFLGEFQENIAPWSRFIEVHPENLDQSIWRGGPIEFVFVDAMKSWDSAHGITCNFFPALIPGRSIIVHQDFKHYYTPWIHLLMYRLRERCIPLYDLPQSSSMVFGVVSPLNRVICERACDFSSFSANEVEEAFQWAKGLCPSGQTKISAANVMYFVHLARENFQKNGLSKQTGNSNVKGLLNYLKF